MSAPRTSPLSPGAFAALQAFLAEEAGIILADGKEYLVQSRLGPLLHERGLTSFASLIEILALPSESCLRRQVLDLMTTHETLWFRDVTPWHALRDVVLPEIVTRKAAVRTLNVWCAAASSGQEPFTFSMLLDDHFPELRSWRRTFIGSDLSEAMLARCREGSYSQLEINRGLPALLLVRHFERQGARYRVSHQLREQWDFRHVNLSQPLPALPRPDLVLLRNVLIYLGDDAKRDVLARVRRAMHPDGWLLLGSGEHPPGLDEHFERVAIGANAAFRPRLPAALLRVSRTPQ